jgi:hypothetical protein
MDADDVMHRERLAVQAAALAADERLFAVGTHVRIFPRAQLAAGWRAYERWLNGIDSAARVRAEAFVECPVVHPTLMLRRAALVDLGYRDVGWPEDYDLVLRALARGLEIGVVPRRLLSWRDGAGRLFHEAYARSRFARSRPRSGAALPPPTATRATAWRALRRALQAREARDPRDRGASRRPAIRSTGAGVSPDVLPSLAPLPVVVSVARPGPRDRIRAAMVEMGFRETVDFVCAA